MTFYHVQGQTHVLLKLVILMLNKQVGVYFNAIYSLVMQFIKFIWIYLI